MVHFSLAVHPLPILLFWLNFGAWVAIWIGLVLRDRGSNVDVHTPTDQGSRAVIGISLWTGVVLAFLLAWAVPAAHLPGSGWPLLLGGAGTDVGRHCVARLGGTDIRTPLPKRAGRCWGLCRYRDLLHLKVHVRIPALEDGTQLPVECSHARL